jgi:hypothetical protein
VLETASSTNAWIPHKLLKACSSKATSDDVTSCICVDSGASRDLFPYQSNFSKYTNISDKGHHVLISTDGSRIPIQGIGTVDCNLSGHEVLLRKVCTTFQTSTPNSLQSGLMAAVGQAAP